MSVEQMEVQEQQSNPEVSQESDPKEVGGEIGNAAVEGGEAKEAVEYTPNFKFKVMDQEKEFDDFVRGAIKDQETEKRVRELYEQAHGLPEVKKSRDEFKTKYQETESKFGQVVQSLQQAGSYLKNKDFRKFAQAFNIPKELVLQYALEELQYSELSPEERARFDAQQAERERVYQTEQQNQQLSQAYQQVMVQARTMEVQTVLERPEVKPVAEAYDARTGKPGSFNDLVWKIGKMYYADTGQDIPAIQAVNEAMALIGAQGAQAANPNPTQGGMPQSQAKAPPASLPNLSGQSTASPARKVVRSLDDIRKRAAELGG